MQKSQILSKVQIFDDEVYTKINLVASENIISNDAKYILSSDIGNRYIIPSDHSKSIWDYPNQQKIIDIYNITCNIAKKLYSASYADVRPLSGNMNMSIVLCSLANAGDCVLSMSASCGGHFTTRSLCKSMHIDLLDVPFVGTKIDIDNLIKIYNKYKPKLLLLDASMILRPYPLRHIRQALGDDIIIVYDASHVFGLIAGGEFQNPLKEGADILMGSTHKSLFGPQKGMILCKDNNYIANAIHDMITPNFTSSAHMHNIAVLGIALEELEAFGHEYATQIIDNARELAKSLDEYGINVMNKKNNYTNSHQIHIALESKKLSLKYFRDLEDIGINLNPIGIPFSSFYGFRVGLCEVTRRGMKKQQMKEIASLIYRCINQENKTKLRQEVVKLSQQFKELHYCFK